MPAGWCPCSSARHCGGGTVWKHLFFFLILITGITAKIYSQVIGFGNHGAQFLYAIVDVKPPPPFNYRRNREEKENNLVKERPPTLTLWVWYDIKLRPEEQSPFRAAGARTENEPSCKMI